MTDLIPTLIFYLFSAVIIFSGVMVIASKNSVHSVFFLILAFFNAAGLFVLLGAEFIAMVLVIVYVGAVAVLFLAVVMMLNINFEELREGFLRYLPVGIVVALVLFVELCSVFYISFHAPQPMVLAQVPIPQSEVISNTNAIGNVLYTYYLLPFQMAGIILLVAMISAITLTLRSRPDVRRQSIVKQIARRREDSMEIVQVRSGEGIV